MTIILVAPTYAAARRVARERNYSDWLWVASVPVAERLVSRARSLGVPGMRRIVEAYSWGIVISDGDEVAA